MAEMTGKSIEEFTRCGLMSQGMTRGGIGKEENICVQVLQMKSLCALLSYLNSRITTTATVPNDETAATTRQITATGRILRILTVRDFTSAIVSLTSGIVSETFTDILFFSKTNNYSTN